ncbi:pitrilysin family protein [Thioalkalivibrio sp. XN279]|uniref:M16 family metallopeptidase n=1 Tax=Thioalkalivibrio sp. XN279 TaxID=2714953 RepID=UPI00140832E9|nr:pitrilysin family protein [Thioalkalivibrio sp. XN279]NHA15840.1 insulinase family protein [Thioalkalivibrio sp. XN279]
MIKIRRTPMVLTLAALAWLAAGCAAPGVDDTAATAALAAAPAPAAGSADLFDLPRQERELANGLKVIVVKTDYPDIVSLQIPVQTGSRNEVEPGKTGFAHFFEHMMFRGTENVTPEEYNAALKRAGADINAYTTDDYTNYHIDFTRADLETILALEADRFMNLSYGEDVFRTEALAVKGEYIKNSANPVRKLFEQVRDAHYEKHTYKHTTMGFFADIVAMPEQYEYSKLFFDRWYRPEKAAIVLVGDLEFEPTFALVEKYFGPWERGSYEAQIPVEPPGGGPTSVYIPVDSPTQPWIAVAFRGPGFEPADPDSAAIRVLAQHYFSDNSDLYRKLVLERQVVDQLFAFMGMNRDPGLFWVMARITDPAATEAVRDEILATFARARTETIAPAELERIKDRMRYGFLAGLDNSVDIAEALAEVVQYDRTVETVNQLYATLAALEPADLSAAAERHFRDDVRTIGVLAQGDALAGLESGAPSVDALASAAAAAAEAEAAFTLVERRSESSPLVDLSLVFHAGAALDPPGKKGLAQLTAMMVAEGGSAARPIDEIRDAMYPMAAGFGAQVGKEMVTFGGTVHRDNLDGWYALISEQLLTPGWREEDFSRLQTQLVNAIVTDLVANNDEELGKEALYQFIYGPDHAYGTLTLGLVEDVQGLTLDDVRAFYAAHYAPANLTVGLAGGYPEDLPARLRRDLAGLPEGTAAGVEPGDAPAIAGHEALILEKDTMAHAVSFGFPIELKRGDPDWAALWLATQWLGQHRSQNSHLFDRIREKRGMNYGDYAYIEYFPRGMYLSQPEPNLYRQQQIFQVWLRPLTGNDTAHFATRVAMYELDKLIDQGLSAEAFEATRAFLDKWVAQLVSAQPALLGYAIDSAWYGIPDFTAYVRAELARLTVEDVNRVIREHLSTENVKFVFITPDAADLKRRLVQDAPSPMTYNSPKPAELLAEDKVIEVLPLGFTPESVRIVPADSVFRRPAQ